MFLLVFAAPPEEAGGMPDRLQLDTRGSVRGRSQKKGTDRQWKSLRRAKNWLKGACSTFWRM